MESETTLALLESYRTDRRELLRYILATNGENVVTPPGVTSLDEIDYDNINVQYVLHRASKGLSLEIADALVQNSTQESDTSSRTVSSAASNEVANSPAEIMSDLEKREDKWNINVDELQLSLPVFETGLSDDDIRETAYEVLLASVGAAGGLVLLTKDKKEENVSKLGKWKPHSNNTSGLAGLMNIMRVQLQITEEVEKRTTEAIFHASNGRLGKRIDSLLLPLELLCNITREDFSNPDIFPTWQKRQLNIIKEGFLNNPHWSLDPSDHLATELLKSASHIENLTASRSSKPRGDALRRIRDVCLAISERNGKSEELCHWADGYYLNVRLYEKLLFGIFQSSECNRFIEEVEEVLELLKSTWRVMGITQTVHDTCYTWVLFKQFVFTGDFVLLQHAARQMKKIAPDRQRSAVERAYLKNLRTSNGRDGSLGLSYIQSVLIPIKSWIDKQLQDYHQNFLQDRTKMEALLAIAITCGRLLLEEEATVQKTLGTSPSVLEQVENYVSSSIKQAYARVLAAVDENAVHHRLVSIAEAVKKLAETDVSFFSPLLSRWGPLSVAVTASVLHTCYYKDLKPVLEKLSLLKDDEVTAILSAADDLEQYLQDLIASVDTADERLNVYKGQMTPFEVETISGNLSMRCTATKLEELSKHVETVFDEENWEPLSAEQRYGRSASDLFQNISKVVDNFFCKELPIRISHLKGLTDGLNDVIQAYSRKVLTQLGDKADLIPPAPALTRYKKELSLKSFAKKKVIDPRLPDEKRSNELKTFSTPKLCVRLNTLHFVLNQLEHLETSIRQRWSEKRPQYTTRKQNLKPKQSEEIFPGFDPSKKFVAWALEQTCEFTGFKLIFWDMREVYVDTLYKGGVAQCRIEKVVNGLDSVLGQLCEVLIEPLRDQVVYGLLEASLEGFLWVLLDGGPSRSFSQGDADILEQDLNVLKEFFIADGDGLPKGVVDNAAAQVHQILNLYRVETHSVVENFKRASEQVTNSTRSVPLVPDSEILLRVLYHRKDKDAAKFLKHYKLPKH